MKVDAEMSCAGFLEVGAMKDVRSGSSAEVHQSCAPSGRSMRVVTGALKRALLLFCAALTACAPIEKTVRTERGPLLRSFTRPQIVEGGAGDAMFGGPRFRAQDDAAGQEG